MMGITQDSPKWKRQLSQWASVALVGSLLGGCAASPQWPWVFAPPARPPPVIKAYAPPVVMPPRSNGSSVATQPACH